MRRFELKQVLSALGPALQTDFNTAPTVGHAAVRPSSRVNRDTVIGDTQIGEWALVRKIGDGDTAEVFAARAAANTNSRVDYALKRLKPSHHDDLIARQMFASEVACGRLASHRNLLPILAAETEALQMYHVAPLIDGVAIRTVIDNCSRFVLPRALWIIRQAADACEALHAANWIHGDIKPGNIIAQSNGHATIVDYGFSVKFGEEHRQPPCLLRTTLSYTAPERFTSNRSASSASDVYSLGVVLFEMLTGKLPFQQQQAARLVEAHLLLPAPSVRSHVPGLPRDVSRLVSRMLAKEPTRRPSVGGELQSELLRLETEYFASFI